MSAQISQPLFVLIAVVHSKFIIQSFIVINLFVSISELWPPLQLKYIDPFPFLSSFVPVSREFTHRVKSISMAKFTAQEVTALQEGGNEVTCVSLTYFSCFQSVSCLLCNITLVLFGCSVLGKYFSRNGMLTGMHTLTAGYLLFFFQWFPL